MVGLLQEPSLRTVRVTGVLKGRERGQAEDFRLVTWAPFSSPGPGVATELRRTEEKQKKRGPRLGGDTER